MPATWDTAQERKLLLAVIDIVNPKPPSWPAVAEKMGEGFTQEACRQHYNKIKRETKGDNVSAPSTPSKTRVTKASTPKSNRSTASKKKEAAMLKSSRGNDALQQNGYQNFESPVKKQEDAEDGVTGWLFKNEELDHVDLVEQDE
ncbi:MAG: hypothetical protein M1819_000463 [Sarea resinae]|nr:MAG: hypothetical protein M1819_000463 [Sarea resinae]